jgi:LPXTG-site transpeptidase (sortase) family protein
VDAGSYVNTATGDTDQTTPSTSTVTVTFPQTPAHTTSKTETSTGPYAVGDTITYNIVVANTGNMTLTGVTVSDSSAVLGTCTPAQPATLAPGASMTCPASHVVTQADVDAGSYVNTATGDTDQTTPSTSTVTVTFPQTPAHTTSKTEASTGPYAVGDTITYNIVVTNTGNVTLTGVTASDSSAVLGACTPAQPATLAPGASMTCSASHVVTQADVDAGSYVNTATGDTDQTTPSTSTVTVTFAQTPSLTLTKTVNPTTVTAVGDVVTYTFSVQNTGTVTLADLTLSDSLLSGLNCTAIASLAPNATQSFTCTGNTYTVTQVDLDNNGGGDGDIDNTATATGTTPGGGTTSDTDSAAVTLPAQNPSLTLTKTPTLDDTVVAPSGVVNVGDTIIYTFSVQNTGNVTITNIAVTDPLLPTLTCTIASLVPGTTASCIASNNVYALTQADINAGLRANTATATGSDPGNNPVTDTDTQTTALASLPSLNVVKEVGTSAGGPWNDTSVSVTVGDTVYYRVRVANTGNVTLTGLTVDDGMAACTLTRGADITGDDDNDFEVGEEWAYTCSVTAVLGTVDNTATADTNETPADTDAASYTASSALVADPAISKAGNPLQASVGETVTFTLTVTNAGNTPAPNVVVTDALPAIFDVTAVNVSGAPLGTLVNVTPPIGVGPAPYTVVVTLGGDLGVTDVVTINIVTTVNAQGNPPINNTASLITTSQTDLVANNTAAVTLTIQPASEVVRKVKKLPATGFAPNVVTVVPPQPKELKYAATEVVLEIPSLGVKTTIVGVPLKNGEWNVSWLGNQAGWLEGSAFPSWNGNSVLTSHVYLSNGLPGPFVNLSKLKFGDRVIVHAYGQRYVFEVRTNSVVEPNNVSIFKHEEKSWLTLVTCKEYDEKTNTYKKRVVVRAVLVSVERE